MQARTFLAIVGAATVLCAGTANAVDRTWDNDSADGKWSTAANWSGDTVPTASDKVILPALAGAYTVSMEAATGHAMYLDMHANATLDIEAGKVLEINADGTNNSTINGVIQVVGSGSVLYVRDSSHTFGGSGSVVMQNAAARVDIAVLKTFTSEITIHGRGLIKGLQLAGNRGTFANNGTVDADVNNGVLELMSDTILSGSGAWKVTACPFSLFDAGAKLKFTRAATGLTGSFTINGGVLDIDADVTTNVDIFYEKGKIDVASGVTFTFGDGSGADSSGTCGTQPASTLSNEVFEGCGC